MEAVYRQARGLLEGASHATGKDEKVSKIMLLVEVCVHRADGPLVQEMVGGVCGFATDRSSATRRAVLDFCERVVAGSESEADGGCASVALETAAFLSLDAAEAVAVRALRVVAVVLERARAGVDVADVSRERICGSVDGARRVESTGGEAASGAYVAAACEALLALLLRDCRRRPICGTRDDVTKQKEGDLT